MSLQTVVKKFYDARINYHAEKNHLQQKKLQQKLEHDTVHHLQHWKKSHPRFYHAITTTHSINQYLSMVTRLFQQAGFTVLQIQPVAAASSSQGMTYTVVGKFSEIFSFLDLLNQSSLPISITQLTIHTHQLTIRFGVLRLHA